MLEANRLKLIHRSLEESSHVRYSGSFRSFTDFCVQTNNIGTHVDEDLLIDYATWRYTYSKVCGKTVDTDISGIISYLNRYACAGLDRTRMFSLLCLMTGFKKMRPSKGSKAALTDKLLKRMVGELKDDDIDDAVLKAALIFKKGLVMRNSEGWKWEFEGKGVLMKNIKFLRKKGEIVGMVLDFGHSKTNQYGKEEYASAPCVCKHKKLCPVHAIWNLIDLKESCGYEMGPNAAIFEKSNGKLLSYREIGCEIKRLCKEVGMDPKAYAPHSLRKGGATDYIAWGVPIIIVKDMGRWKAIESMEPYRQLDAISLIRLATDRIDKMLFKL